MRTYAIDCKCQIVLYGFNNYTQKQISEIKEQGYFCGGIIDRRAHEIKMYQDIPVVSDIREPAAEQGCMCIYYASERVKSYGSCRDII